MVDGINKVNDKANILGQSFGIRDKGLGEFVQTISSCLLAIANFVVVEKGAHGNTEADVRLLQKWKSGFVSAVSNDEHDSNLLLADFKMVVSFTLALAVHEHGGDNGFNKITIRLTNSRRQRAEHEQALV